MSIKDRMETISIFYNYDVLNMEHHYLFTGFEKTKTFDYFKTFFIPYCDELKVVGDNQNELSIVVHDKNIQTYKTMLLDVVFIDPPARIRFSWRGLIF